MLNDKIAVVTGACGGIGEAVARAFATAGARLALCDLRDAELEQLAGELAERGTEVLAEAVDVADEGQVRRLAAQVGERYGRVDALVNTVGVVDNMGTVETLSSEEWDRTLAINLTSAFLTAKHLVPAMKEHGGAIVNLASVSGLANQAEAMVYSVTKAALISLTKSEAIDLAPHRIRAVAICPGSVSTPLVDEAVEITAERLGRPAAEQRAEWESQYPIGRFTAPAEVAELAVFLCSDRAAAVTGVPIVIDGGLTAVLPER